MTPTCPNCGAKFAHARETASCKKCGLPDEIAAQGAGRIKAWRINNLKALGLSNKQIKVRETLRGGSAGRRRYKHGRVGVARA